MTLKNQPKYPKLAFLIQFSADSRNPKIKFRIPDPSLLNTLNQSSKVTIPLIDDGMLYHTKLKKVRFIIQNFTEKLHHYLVNTYF